MPTPTTVLTPASASGKQGARAIPATSADVPRITLDELRPLMASPQRVLVLDTRSVDEYEAGHIPGAANMPLAQVETLYQQLPREIKLVTYCA